MGGAPARYQAGDHDFESRSKHIHVHVYDLDLECMYVCLDYAMGEGLRTRTLIMCKMC